MAVDWWAMAVGGAAGGLIAWWNTRKPSDPRGGWPTWDNPKAPPPSRVDHAGTTGGQWRAARADFDDALADIQTELTEAIVQAREQLEDAKAVLDEARREIEGFEGPDALSPPAPERLGEKALREKEEEIATLREEIERLRAEKGYR